MNNWVFGKTMENVRKHWDIKLVTTEKNETIWYLNQVIIQQSFYQNIFMNKPVYLGVSIL